MTLRAELEPFDIKDTAAYIASRFATAGGVASRVFTREAITLIHEKAGGIPRIINVICDNALVSGMALGQQRVDRAMVVEVCRDLRLKSNGVRPSPAREEASELRDEVAVGSTYESN